MLNKSSRADAPIHIRENDLPKNLGSAGARRLLRRAAEVLFLCVLILYISERQAYAYTDPGSGALIWQMLVAAFIGAGFYFRKVLFWFKGKRDSREQKD